MKNLILLVLLAITTASIAKAETIERDDIISADMISVISSNVPSLHPFHGSPRGKVLINLDKKEITLIVYPHSTSRCLIERCIPSPVINTTLSIVNIYQNSCGAYTYEAETEESKLGGAFETITVTDNYSQTKCMFIPEEMPGKTVIEYTRNQVLSRVSHRSAKVVLEASALVNVPYIHN